MLQAHRCRSYSEKNQLKPFRLQDNNRANRKCDKNKEKKKKNSHSKNKEKSTARKVKSKKKMSKKKMDKVKSEPNFNIYSLHKNVKKNSKNQKIVSEKLNV